MKDTEELKNNIWKDYCNGINTLDIAKKYQISRSYCYQVISVRKGSSDPDMKHLVDELESTKRSLEKLIEENKKLEEENNRLKKIIDRLLLSSQ